MKYSKKKKKKIGKLTKSLIFLIVHLESLMKKNLFNSDTNITLKQFQEKGLDFAQIEHNFTVPRFENFVTGKHLWTNIWILQLKLAFWI